MTTIIVFAVTVVMLFTIHVYIVDKMRKEALQERTALIEMIQAKDLPEYKALNAKSPVPKEPKQPREELIEV